MHTLRRNSPDYPSRILELRDPPATLMLRGELPPLANAVAIVGARRASEQGRRIARSIARDLGLAGITVISGGARGIDISAHLGALDAGARTLVVLPTSLDAPAPRENRAIFDRILAGGGAWLSEHRGPVGRWSFCKRNRLIAALAELVLVIEAGAHSGTRYTIDAAISLGRPLAAIPWSLDDSRGAGCIDLLRKTGRTVTRAADVLALLGVDLPPVCAEPFMPEGSLDARVLALVTRGVCELDPLATQAGATLPELLAVLTSLELEGAITLRNGRVDRAA